MMGYDRKGVKEGWGVEVGVGYLVECNARKGRACASEGKRDGR